MKLHSMNSVRTAFKLPTNDKIHFQRSEMMHIVETITGETPEWTSVDYFFEEELTDYGWVSQTTVDTHPNLRNLECLLSLSQYEGTETSSRMTTLFQILKDSGYMNPREMVVNESNIVISF